MVAQNREFYIIIGSGCVVALERTILDMSFEKMK